MGFIKGRYEESPPFRYTINTGDLTAGAVYTKSYNTAEDPEAKYLPFNHVTITNLSSQKLEFIWSNGSYAKIIPPNAIIDIKSEDIYGFQLKNIDSLANDDEIEIIVERRYTVEDLLKKLLNVWRVI